MSKEVAKWICAQCAKENKGKIMDKISCYHEGICDLCWNWTSVTEPRDFKLSGIEADHNFKYILKVLADEYVHYVKLEQKNPANIFFNELGNWHRKMMENLK